MRKIVTIRTGVVLCIGMLLGAGLLGSGMSLFTENAMASDGQGGGGGVIAFLIWSLRTIEEKIDTADGKVDALEAKLDAIEAKEDSADLDRNTLEAKLDVIEAKLDAAEVKLDAL